MSLNELMPNTEDWRLPVAIVDQVSGNDRTFCHATIPGLSSDSDTKREVFTRFHNQFCRECDLEETSPLQVGQTFRILSGFPHVAARHAFKRYSNMIQDALIRRLDPQVDNWTLKYLVVVDSSNRVQDDTSIRPRRIFAKIEASVTVATLLARNAGDHTFPMAEWTVIAEHHPVVTGTFFFQVRRNLAVRFYRKYLGHLVTVTPSMMRTTTPERSFNDPI